MLDAFKGTVTPKDWIFVGAMLGVTAALCAVFYLLVYQKQIESLTEWQGKVKAKSAELQNAEHIASEFETYEAKFKQMEFVVDGFENRLPDQREIRSLVTKFESLGGQLGLQVELNQGKTTSDGNKETYSYGVTATGDYHDIVTFINLFERDERYMKVSELDVQEQKDRVTKATFTLSTFRFVQKTAEAAS